MVARGQTGGRGWAGRRADVEKISPLPCLVPPRSQGPNVGPSPRSHEAGLDREFLHAHLVLAALKCVTIHVMEAIKCAGRAGRGCPKWPCDRLSCNGRSSCACKGPAAARSSQTNAIQNTQAAAQVQRSAEQPATQPSSRCASLSEARIVLKEVL